MNDELAHQILQSQGEIKGELVALTGTVTRVEQQVATQNGNVRELVAWRREVELREERALGRVEGRDGLRKSTIALLTAVVGVVSAAGTTVAAIVARFV